MARNWDVADWLDERRERFTAMSDDIWAHPQVALAESAGAARRIISMKGVNESPNFYADLVKSRAILTTVVDSGVARIPRVSPRTGMTRLETVRVSRASADQRRAGRDTSRSKLNSRITSSFSQSFRPNHKRQSNATPNSSSSWRAERVRSTGISEAECSRSSPQSGG